MDIENARKTISVVQWISTFNNFFFHYRRPSLRKPEHSHPVLYICARMDINCTEKELFVLKKIAHAAAEIQVPCYVIGGFVRDKIVGRPTKDMDIVCVGDGITLAHAVSKRFNPSPKVS